MMAAIMGADEYGFGSVAMIATGCVMARICHTNNCPVGVASQVNIKLICYYMLLCTDFCALCLYLIRILPLHFRGKSCVHAFRVFLVILSTFFYI